MAVSLSVIAAKDSAGAAIAGGLQAQDKSGAGSGPFTLGQVLIDGLAGVNMAAVTAANAVKVDGSAVTQPVSLASVPSHAVTNAGTFAVQSAATLSAETTKVIGTVNVAAAQTLGLVAGSALIGKVDVQFAGTVPDTGAGTGGSKTQRMLVDSSQIGTQQTTAQAMSGGYTLVGLPTNQSWANGMSPKAFSAAFTTLTRPANTTAYTAADSISNNATAGSVTALTATLSDTNDDPITLTDILVSSTDTGLAGKRIRAYLYNSDPTASTGVVGGDNAAFSNKVAGYIGSMSGVLETGFSDGTVGRLVPSYNDGAAASTPNAPSGGFIVVKPTSGAKTLFIQYQAIDGFTPSANSTTIIGTARGFQGRAS